MRSHLVSVFFPRDAATLVVNGTDAHPILSGSSPKGGGGEERPPPGSLCPSQHQLAGVARASRQRRLRKSIPLRHQLRRGGGTTRRRRCLGTIGGVSGSQLL